MHPQCRPGVIGQMARSVPVERCLGGMTATVPAGPELPGVALAPAGPSAVQGDHLRAGRRGCLVKMDAAEG